MKRLRPNKSNFNTEEVLNYLNLYDDLFYKLISKYIILNYPIEKVKYKGKFKRCINLNGEFKPISLIKDDVINIVSNDISNVFDIPHIESVNIVKRCYRW